MASIGGLDLGYGSQAQIIRTNVLCIAVASGGISNVTGARHVHNTIKEGLKGSMLEPDFTYFFDDASETGSGFDTAATAGLMFDNDADNDGTAETTSLENGGILRDIRQVPLAPNSAHADTTATHHASGFGNAHTLHDVGDISGNLMLQSVLSAGGVILRDQAADVDGGLFVDDDADTGSPVAASNDDANETGGLFAGEIQAKAMDVQYTNMNTNSASGKNYGNLHGSGATGISTGARLGPYTIDLSAGLTQMNTAMGSGATAANLSASATDADSYQTIVGDLDDMACILSVCSIAKVC